MPLVKRTPNADTVAAVMTPSLAPAPIEIKVEKVATEQAAEKPAKKSLSKDDYWTRKEERDIETGIRIRRSGVWQAALQSVGVLQYSPNVRTLEDYLKIVQQAAEDGLRFVNEGK